MQVLIAGLHLVGLTLAVYGLLGRSAALKEEPTEGSLKRVFRTDAIFGLGLLILVSTGLYRLLGPIDKGTVYYMKNGLFHGKLTLIILLLALEISPFLALKRARAALHHGTPAAEIIPKVTARRIAMFSHVQLLFVVIIIFLASGMARGYGSRPAAGVASSPAVATQRA